jgi:hypothetical protein
MMLNRLTTIVIAGALSFGAATTASAAGRHQVRYDGALRLASLGGNDYCNERPWVCEGQQAWGGMATSRAVHRGHLRVTERHGPRGPAVSDLVSQLRSKISEIMSACGSKLISGYRPGAHIAGTAYASLHSIYPARAADVEGNPSCIYSHLQGWAGGYSVDYGRVRHVHISYSPPGSGYLAGREWHARFNHYEGGSHHVYFRHVRHHGRYAMR